MILEACLVIGLLAVSDAPPDLEPVKPRRLSAWCRRELVKTVDGEEESKSVMKTESLVSERVESKSGCTRDGKIWRVIVTPTRINASRIWADLALQRGTLIPGGAGPGDIKVEAEWKVSGVYRFNEVIEPAELIGGENREYRARLLFLPRPPAK